MENLRYIILDEFDGKPLRAFSNKASAKWFLENRPGCKLRRMFILRRVYEN